MSPAPIPARTSAHQSRVMSHSGTWASAQAHPGAVSHQPLVPPNQVQGASRKVCEPLPPQCSQEQKMAWAPGTGRRYPHPVVSLVKQWGGGREGGLEHNVRHPICGGQSRTHRSTPTAFRQQHRQGDWRAAPKGASGRIWPPDAALPESLSAEEGRTGRPSGCVASAQRADGSKSIALELYPLLPQGWGSHPPLSGLQPPKQGQSRTHPVF